MNYKIFIINLEDRVDRKQSTESQLKKYNIDNYEFIEAIDGNKLDIDPVSLPNDIDRKHLGKKFRRHFSNNEIACVQSHIKAIKKAKELDLDYVIILEDDIIICEDWNKRLEKLMKMVPGKWNHIFLSGKPNESMLKFKPLNLAPFLHIEQSINTMGAFSYVLKKDIYDLVISELEKMELPVDDVIKDLIEDKKIKSYTFYPFLTYHENEIPSSIWDEKIWKQEYYYEHDSIRYYVKKMS